MKLKDFDNEVTMQRIAELNVIADQFGWKNINVNVTTKLVSYVKLIEEGACRIDVYYTTMTVSISLHHPKKGKTQLHRKHVSDKELEVLFKNPRAHTGKGYYKKSRRSAKIN